MFKWVSNFFEPTYSDYHIIKDYEQKVKKVKDKALVELKKSGEEDEKLETYTESLRFEREQDNVNDDIYSDIIPTIEDINKHSKIYKYIYRFFKKCYFYEKNINDKVLVYSKINFNIILKSISMVNKIHLTFQDYDIENPNYDDFGNFIFCIYDEKTGTYNDNSSLITPLVENTQKMLKTTLRILKDILNDTIYIDKDIKNKKEVILIFKTYFKYINYYIEFYNVYMKMHYRNKLKFFGGKTKKRRKTTI